MGKVKQWAEDMAEEYLDELIKNVKNKVLTVAQAVDEAREKDVNWDLIGINSEDDLIECLEIETA
jgi:hypothetical protein|tara:strand:+ start:425 stop:619 length:195 start_codon:yes stop_codon:yes gene_type:complete